MEGWSTEMPGLGARPGTLADKLAAERPFLGAAGKVLNVYLQGLQTDTGSAAQDWANALYWAGEAKRETSDFMAVVKYGRAADVLCGAGGNKSNMTTFAETALNPKNESPAAKAVSIKDAVRKVYASDERLLPAMLSTARASETSRSSSPRA